jgi:hypothetical protein
METRFTSKPTDNRCKSCKISKGNGPLKGGEEEKKREREKKKNKECMQTTQGTVQEF